MALLDILRKPFKAAGKNLDEYIGGLLGEDMSSLSDDERKMLRRRAIASIGESMASGIPASRGLERLAAVEMQRRQEQREEARRRQAMEEVQRASGQISGRLLGGAPVSTAPGMPGEELGGVNIESQYRQDPMSALRIAMSPAGAAAMQGNPALSAMMQSMVKPDQRAEPKIMSGPGGSIYSVDPSTGRATILVQPEKKAAEGEKFKDPQDLRKEVSLNIKPYSEIGDMWAKVREAGANPTAANDIALIFGYMKILDPGSVVREGEFATAQNAAGVPDRIRAAYNSAVNGQRLSEVQRQSFLQSAYGAVKSQVPRVNSILDYYRGVAKASNINPELILRDPLKGSMLPKVNNDADYNNLPPGTLFEDPDGQLRIKPRNK